MKTKFFSATQFSEMLSNGFQIVLINFLIQNVGLKNDCHFEVNVSVFKNIFSDKQDKLTELTLMLKSAIYFHSFTYKFIGQPKND